MDKKIKKFYEFINAPNITASNFPLYKLKAPSFLSDKDKPLEYQKRFYNDIMTKLNEYKIEFSDSFIKLTPNVLKFTI